MICQSCVHEAIDACMKALIRGQRQALNAAAESADSLIHRLELTGDALQAVESLRDGYSSASNLLDITEGHR